jgi:hypothetical protein
MKQSLNRRTLLRAAGLGAGALLVPTTFGVGTASASVTSSGPISVADGETVTISSTTRTNLLSIASGGTLSAPSGYILTVTVNGVETGSQLVSTYGVTTVIAAGTYRGEVVIDVALENPQTFFGAFTYQLRQAVYVDAAGINSAYSALSAVTAGKLGASSLDASVVASA